MWIIGLWQKNAFCCEKTIQKSPIFLNHYNQHLLQKLLPLRRQGYKGNRKVPLVNRGARIYDGVAFLQHKF